MVPYGIGYVFKYIVFLGFERKCFRGKLAIAITANFINSHSRVENCIEEIGGIFYIFKQEFFNSLREDTGIDLENFVYYKDETHYFVMTVKKECLLERGVLKEVCVLKLTRGAYIFSQFESYASTFWVCHTK